MRNGNVSGIAPLDLKGGKVKNKPSTTSSTVEEIHDVSLQIEEDGSFGNRVLRREEGIGHSSRSYYRATVQGRVPFDWEVEPGKPKPGVTNEPGGSSHGIPPLRPPPILQASNAHNLRESSGGRRKVGLFQKIKDFLQGKTLTKSRKLRQRQSPTLGDLMRSQSVGRPESGGSDRQIYGEDNAFIPFRYSAS